MGLPIWRDPEEKKSGKHHAKSDSPACLRPTGWAIRRRPSVHGYRTTRTRLPRDPNLLPPPFERTRSARRDDRRGVPPVSSLLETAETRPLQPLILPPVPEVESRTNTSTHLERLEELQRRDRNRLLGEVGSTVEQQRRMQQQLRRHLTDLRVHNAELDRERDRFIREAADAGVPEVAANLMRRSATPPSTLDEPTQPMHDVAIDPGQPLRILRSPEPMHIRRRPESHDGASARRNALPTPPLEISGPEEETADSSLVGDAATDEITESSRLRRAQSLHPLRHSWQASESPDSAIDGLGDRNRSPTPGDRWEIMRMTIAADENLPSQDSSFASAAASRSFNVSSTNSQSTAQTSLSSMSRNDHDSDSVSSLDPDDFVCSDDDIYSTEAFADDMYFHEMRTPDGRERIAAHQRARDQSGNRFALASEPARVDIGFRLIEEALDTEEGRERVLQIRQGGPDNIRHFEDMLAASRRVRSRRARDGVPSPQPERYGAGPRQAALEARREVHRRFAADAMPFERPVDGPVIESPTSPPPEYEALNSHPDVETFTSRDQPEPHPVSPPSNRSEREVSEALLSGDVQDLDSMRRIVERLAARDDVPEEWWMSMGLNMSRARPRDRSPARDPRRGNDTARTTNLGNVRSGRIERNNSRL